MGVLTALVITLEARPSTSAMSSLGVIRQAVGQSDQSGPADHFRKAKSTLLSLRTDIIY